MVLGFGLEYEKHEVVFELFDKKFIFGIDVNAVDVCNNIRSEAKEMLDNLDKFDDKKVIEVVADFLAGSLEILVGKENTEELKKCCDMKVPTLTGILCYVISEIGAVFSDDGEKVYE